MTREPVCLLLEYAPLGSLRAVIANAASADASTLTDDIKYALMSGIVSGMSALHSMKPSPILHHDLKSLNVLIFDSHVAKITDFGNATDTTLSTLATKRGANNGARTDPLQKCPRAARRPPHSRPSHTRTRLSHL